MTKPAAQFPASAWDRTSSKRGDINTYEPPLPEDYDQISSEVVALENVFVAPSLIGAWTPLTPANSWTNHSGFVLGFRQIGSWVYLKGVVDPGTVTDGTTIGTLPAAARPATALTFPAPVSGAGTPANNCRVLIGTDGTIKCYGVVAQSNLDLNSIRFFIDQ